MEAQIYSPKILNEAGAFTFIAELSKYQEADSVVLDFSRTKFAYPLGSLIFIAEFRTFMTGKRRILSTVDIDEAYPVHGYLGHMGFFKSLGIDRGKRPGQSMQGSSYVPVTILTRQRPEDQRLSPNFRQPL